MAQAKKSSFAIWITLISVLVIGGIIAAVVFMNSQLRGEATPLNDGQAGKGSQTIQVYADYMCSHCKNFEDTFAEDIKKINTGDVAKVEYIPVAIMDRVSPDGSYSTRAANAAYCVADENPAGVETYTKTIFALQPTNANPTFPTNDDLIEIATEAGAPNAAECINNLTYENIVKMNTRAMPANPETGQRGTPTLTLDGKYFAVSEFQANLPTYLGQE